MNKWTIFISSMVLFALTCGLPFVLAQPALIAHEYGQTDPSLTQTGSTDLNTCQRECRMRYGYEPQSDIQEHHRRGGSSGSYYEYANCIAACNAQFWKEFDENTRNLERMR